MFSFCVFFGSTTYFKMIKLILSVALVATMGLAEIPDECKSLPISKVRPCDCCMMPKLFSDEDAKTCGYSVDGNAAMEMSSSPFDRTPCEKETCLLRRLNILTGDNKVDKDASKKLLDKITAADADFLDFVDAIKSNCVDRDLTTVGTPGVCEPKKILHCFAFTTITKCPKWKEVDDCIELKQRVDKCKEYYTKN